MTNRILIFLSLSVLLTAAASAGIISINQTHEDEPNDSPGQATTLNDNSGIYPCAFLNPGDNDYYVFTTSVPNAVLTVEAVGAPFVTDTYLTILDSGENPLASADTGGSTASNAKITNLTLPDAGTYYIWVNEAMGDSGAGYTYTLTGQIYEPDATPPYYSGSSGIISAVRTTPTTVDATWNQAIDDVTLAANMRYNIYYDTSETALFSGAPKQTVTGTLSATMIGLDSSSTYYFGVRAEDEAGNEETNTVDLQVEPLTAANPAVWTLYQ